MADQFTNQTTTSFTDFMGKLNTFVVTTMGWTGEDLDGVGTLGYDSSTGEAAWSKAAAGTNTADIQVAFQHEVASPTNLGIYQYNHASGAGNYQSANNPYDQPTDSGSGEQTTVDATLEDGRYCEIGATPVQFWAFAGTSPAEYVYVVVETTSGEYRHFGFGELKKFNDWNGGAFAYGFKHVNSGSNFAVQAGASYLLDGYYRLNNEPTYMATIQADGLPNQDAAGMWGSVGSVEQHYLYSDFGDDRQTVPVERAIFQGGLRQSIGASLYGDYPASPTTGFVPGYPIMTMFVDHTLAVDDWYGPMGVMDGVRGVNIDQFTPAEEVDIGGVTWVLFPFKKKESASGGTANAGLMYRKNVV